MHTADEDQMRRKMSSDVGYKSPMQPVTTKRHEMQSYGDGTLLTTQTHAPYLCDDKRDNGQREAQHPSPLMILICEGVCHVIPIDEGGAHVVQRYAPTFRVEEAPPLEPPPTDRPSVLIVVAPVLVHLRGVVHH